MIIRAARSANEVEQLGSVAGIGDLNLLAKYRLTEGPGGPGFALIGGIKAADREHAQRSPDGERLETEHQPGSGAGTRSSALRHRRARARCS